MNTASIDLDIVGSGYRRRWPSPRTGQRNWSQFKLANRKRSKSFLRRSSSPAPRSDADHCHGLLRRWCRSRFDPRCGNHFDQYSRRGNCESCCASAREMARRRSSSRSAVRKPRFRCGDRSPVNRVRGRSNSTRWSRFPRTAATPVRATARPAAKGAFACRCGPSIRSSTS